MLAYQDGLIASNPLQFLTATVPQGGVPANVLLITPLQLQAWTDITNGIKNSTANLIWTGNTLFAMVEQMQTIQAVLALDLPLWKKVTASKTIYSPMPGDTSNFQDFASSIGFDGASCGSSSLRLAWFSAKMVPAWQNWRTTNNNILLKNLFGGAYSK
jgi:hypothetical protein